MNKNAFMLIGEEIAGDWNVQALSDIATAFGGDYQPYAAHVGEEALYTGTGDTNVSDTAASDLLSAFDWLLAAENGHDAQNIYALKPPALQTRALIVGNEAKGLRRKTRKGAHAVAEIPLVSQNINCLNVAAAAAIMLYYLHINAQRSAPLGQSGRTWAAVQKARPDILLLGGRDPMELGSVIRSACAFGWERVFLEDRRNAWYDCDRLMKSEGRGAARRGRNPIKVIPCPDDLLAHYKSVIVVTCEPSVESNESTLEPSMESIAESALRVWGGKALHQSLLTQRSTGPILIVLPDESENAADWVQAAQERVCIDHVSLPAITRGRYHYRQAASIALAEIARQLGHADGNGLYLHGKKQRFQKSVEEDASATPGAWIDLEDLLIF